MNSSAAISRVDSAERPVVEGKEVMPSEQTFVRYTITIPPLNLVCTRAGRAIQGGLLIRTN
mgnify:FL=1